MSVRLLGRGSLGVLLIAAACVPAAGIAAASHTSNVPAQLVGHWKRTVSKADIKRTGGTGVPPNAHCNLSISRNGAATVTCTSIGSFPGTSSRRGPIASTSSSACPILTPTPGRLPELNSPSRTEPTTSQTAKRSSTASGHGDRQVSQAESNLGCPSVRE